ncbi:hypothetical protein BJ165DRAFT_1588464 [Panaeolus papilionaceus]|nr:hypothetical protein BJ165DRAFT_1588464 [Panaeolus papilionaceus]
MNSRPVHAQSDAVQTSDQGPSDTLVPESMSKEAIRELILHLMQSYTSVKAIPDEEIEAMVTIIHCQQTDPTLSHIRGDLKYWIRSSTASAQSAQHHSTSNCGQILNPSHRDGNPYTPSTASDKESLELDDERSDFYGSTPGTTSTSTLSSTNTNQTSRNHHCVSMPINTMAMSSANPSPSTSSASAQCRYQVPAHRHAFGQPTIMARSISNTGAASHVRSHSTPNVLVNVDPSVAYWNRIDDMAHRYLGPGPRPRVDGISMDEPSRASSQPSFHRWKAVAKTSSIYGIKNIASESVGTFGDRPSNENTMNTIIYLGGASAIIDSQGRKQLNGFGSEKAESASLKLVVASDDDGIVCFQGYSPLNTIGILLTSATILL